MNISINKEQAREILKAIDCCFGGDHIVDLNFLLDEIKKAFPELAAEEEWFGPFINYEGAYI